MTASLFVNDLVAVILFLTVVVFLPISVTLKLKSGVFKKFNKAHISPLGDFELRFFSVSNMIQYANPFGVFDMVDKVTVHNMSIMDSVKYILGKYLLNFL